MIPPGSPDELVAAITERAGYVLISFGKDFRKIRPRLPRGHRERFRKLHRIGMDCGEPGGAERLESALDLIEFAFARLKRLEVSQMIVRVKVHELTTER